MKGLITNKISLFEGFFSNYTLIVGSFRLRILLKCLAKVLR
jgi:hypothetical protein